ncbi:MAG: deoxyribonuclease V [Microcystaceae cyanobacterium]
MKIPSDSALFPFPKDLKEAKTQQIEIAKQVISKDQFSPLKTVAGVDVAFKNKGSLTLAAAVVLRFPSLELIESAIAVSPTPFPYLSGFLSFREIPAILKVLSVLSITPDLIFCDGQGFAHPRRCGIACHLGVLLNYPTIGVAKSLLLGQHELVGEEKGNWVRLTHKEETIGAVLRSRSYVKPLYISIGHRISLTTAIDLVLRCTSKYRLPETTRLADKLSKM